MTAIGSNGKVLCYSWALLRVLQSTLMNSSLTEISMLPIKPHSPPRRRHASLQAQASKSPEKWSYRSLHNPAFSKKGCSCKTACDEGNWCVQSWNKTSFLLWSTISFLFFFFSHMMFNDTGAAVNCMDLNTIYCTAFGNPSGWKTSCHFPLNHPNMHWQVLSISMNLTTTPLFWNCHGYGPINQESPGQNTKL